MVTKKNSREAACFSISIRFFYPERYDGPRPPWALKASGKASSHPVSTGSFHEGDRRLETRRIQPLLQRDRSAVVPVTQLEVTALPSSSSHCTRGASFHSLSIS